LDVREAETRKGIFQREVIKGEIDERPCYDYVIVINAGIRKRGSDRMRMTT